MPSIARLNLVAAGVLGAVALYVWTQTTWNTTVVYSRRVPPAADSRRAMWGSVSEMRSTVLVHPHAALAAACAVTAIALACGSLMFLRRPAR